MALPIQIFDVNLISNGDMSTNLSSSILEVKEALRLAIQLNWSGTSPVGTIHIKGSNDGINFDDDSEISPYALSGSSGTKLLKIVNCSYSYLQINYVFTSGIGRLNVIVSGKRQ